MKDNFGEENQDLEEEKMWMGKNTKMCRELYTPLLFMEIERQKITKKYIYDKYYT